MLERTPREHPEMRGRKLETISPQDKTVKRLTDTVTEKLNGKKVVFIETDEANYTCTNYGSPDDGKLDSIITVVHKEPNDINALATDYTVTRTDLDKYKIKKVEIPLKYIRVKEEDRKLISEQRAKNMQDQEDLEKLTHLPQISEAEVERLWLDLTIGKAQIDLEDPD